MVIGNISNNLFNCARKVGVSVKVYVQYKETSVSYKHMTLWNVTKANWEEKLKLAPVL